MRENRFSDEYETLPDYIYGITERIWEGRGIGLIRRYYGADCLMHTGMGPVRGVEAVVKGTLETLHAFPDRRLLPEEVIWSDDGGAGLLSSHRNCSVAVHAGSGVFGPATGRPIRVRAIADCRVEGDVIVEEWLVRDQAGMVRQIGLEPAEVAARMADSDAAAGRGPWHLEAWQGFRADPDAGAILQDHPAAALVCEAWDTVWNRTDLSAIRRFCHEAYGAYAPEARALHGHAQLDAWVIGYLAAFPDARLAIDHSCALEEPGKPVRVATRFWLTGTHDGHGAFGPPTGAKVLGLGIVHSEIRDGRIRDEWILLDELALWKQIRRQAG